MRDESTPIRITSLRTREKRRTSILRLRQSDWPSCGNWRSVPGHAKEKRLLNRDFRDILSLFNEERVDYLGVGAYALAFHGLPRATGDIDPWVRCSNEKDLAGALQDDQRIMPTSPGSSRSKIHERIRRSRATTAA